MKPKTCHKCKKLINQMPTWQYNGTADGGKVEYDIMNQQEIVSQETQLPALPVYEDPTVILERSSKWANALMKVVDEKEMFAVIQEKKYLEVEAWQLVLMFADAQAITREPAPLTDGEGKITGYQCTTDLYQNGQIVGSGTSVCGLDSHTAKDRVGMDQHKAAQSTAQTHSISRAAKNRFGFVAKLAGFESTPAEEMRGGGGGALSTDPMKFCPLHQLEWFKRGAMRQEAHPLEGEKGPRGGAKWCNQDDVLAKLSDDMKFQVRRLALDAEAIKDLSEGWANMTPQAKLDTVGNLERTVDTETGEIITSVQDDPEYPDGAHGADVNDEHGPDDVQSQEQADAEYERRQH